MNNWIPDFIIEKLRELERQKREREYEDARPRIYAPSPIPLTPPEYDHNPEEAEPSRGPVIIDINNYEIINEDE